MPPTAISKTKSDASNRRTPWLIWMIVAVCFSIEATLLLADWGVVPITRLRFSVYEYAGFWPGLMRSWIPNYPSQPYLMFLTYAFLHSGPIHMTVNMITLYSVGTLVHARVGNRGVFLLFFAAVLGGGLGFGLLAETTQPMVGASGGLFGLAGGILAWNYVDRFSAALRLWPIVQGVLALLALNLIMWWLMDGLLAWQTHLGGFVAGWIAAMLIDPRGQPVEDSEVQ